ncbi:MAG: response regulator [Anaerolineales bacterium]|nr:response regulator [Anaerolineales bacterium]
MTDSAPAADTVLIVDDDEVALRLMRVHLERAGFHVQVARGGADGVRLAFQQPPALVICGALLPDMSGLRVCQRLAEENRTRHIPLILFASQPRMAAILEALDGGADDVLVQPIDYRELVARVRAHIRRAHLKPALNPLTGLAGNLIIEREIRRVTEAAGSPFAVLYIDLNNFKSYNDVYGFPAGDEAIRLLAGLISTAAAEAGDPGDLVGHVGGDDFVVITTPPNAELIAQRIITDFDRQAPELYTPADRHRGYLTAKDRQGMLRKFPLLSVVIAIVHNELRPITSHWEVGELGAELKHFAKARGGSLYLKDQRRV